MRKQPVPPMSLPMAAFIMAALPLIWLFLLGCMARGHMRSTDPSRW